MCGEWEDREFCDVNRIFDVTGTIELCDTGHVVETREDVILWSRSWIR